MLACVFLVDRIHTMRMSFSIYLQNWHVYGGYAIAFLYIQNEQRFLYKGQVRFDPSPR